MATSAATRYLNQQELSLTPRAFYRPELDVLRFLAFLSVFICHGPRLYPRPDSSAWQDQVKRVVNVLEQSGVYGLCLFFLLSSYLITELLLREREKTGSVHLKSFYIRRILRIWPLYFLGLAVGFLFTFIDSRFYIDRTHWICLLLFLGWLGGKYIGHNPICILWSISVEELFYLIWPNIAKWCSLSSLGVISAAIVPISLLSAVIGVRYESSEWYNPITQFVFFAIGALLAVVLRSRNYILPPGTRLAALLGALLTWTISATGYTPSEAFFPWPVLPLLGCVLMFLALFGCPRRFLPRSLIYLGQISYGLYVFHGCCFELVQKYVVPFLPGSHHDSVRVVEVYIVSLASVIAVAAFSYHFFEKPFLELKKRFTFIPSRPVNA